MLHNVHHTHEDDMFILINISDNTIIGCASRPIDEIQAEKDGYKVFEIDDSEWKPSMLGSKVESYEEIGS